MATVANAFSGDVEALHSFNKNFYALALQHFPRTIACALRPRVRALAKSLASGKTEEPPVEAIRLVPSSAMKAMASRRKITINTYLNEIADADWAEYKSICFANETHDSSPLRKIERTGNDHHRTRTSIKIRAKIIAAQDLGLSSAELCRRFGLASSTIRRIIQREKDCDE